MTNYNRADARHRIKRSIVTGSTPTFKAQEDFTDGSFSIFDCRPGEFFWNMVDQTLFITNLSGFNQVQLMGAQSSVSAQTQIDLIVDAVTAMTITSASTRIYVPATFDDNLIVSGNTFLDGTLNVNGATDLNSTLDVDGVTNFNNTVDFAQSVDFNSVTNFNQNTITYYSNSEQSSTQYTITAQTYDSTVTNVASFVTNDNSVRNFKITAIGNGGSFAYSKSFESVISGRTSSVPVTIGAEYALVNTNNSLLGVDIELDTFLGLGIVRIRVAGLAATTFNWNIKLDLIKT